MKRACSIYIIQMIVAISLVSSSWAADWQEFAVFPTSYDQELPDIYGNIIVWQEYLEVDENGDGVGDGIWDWDVYGADITDKVKQFFKV